MDRTGTQTVNRPFAEARKGVRNRAKTWCASLLQVVSSLLSQLSSLCVGAWLSLIALGLHIGEHGPHLGYWLVALLSFRCDIEQVVLFRILFPHLKKWNFKCWNIKRWNVLVHVMVHIKYPDCLLLKGTGLGVLVTSGSFNSLVVLPFPTHSQCWCEEVQSQTCYVELWVEVELYL